MLISNPQRPSELKTPPFHIEAFHVSHLLVTQFGYCNSRLWCLFNWQYHTVYILACTLSVFIALIKIKHEIYQFAKRIIAISNWQASRQTPAVVAATFNVTDQTCCDLMTRYCQTGDAKDRQRTGRPRITPRRLIRTMTPRVRECRPRKGTSITENVELIWWSIKTDFLKDNPNVTLLILLPNVHCSWFLRLLLNLMNRINLSFGTHVWFCPHVEWGGLQFWRLLWVTDLH